MIHLMALPNPDPLEGRPSHGGRDRHTCVGVASLVPLEDRLAEAGILFTRRSALQNIIPGLILPNHRALESDY